MFAMFTVIQVAVSLLVVMRLVRIANGMPGKWAKKVMHRLFDNVLTFLAVNLAVSVFLALFTGAGTQAGMANIASSVVVSLFGRYFYRAYLSYLQLRSKYV